MGNWIWMKGDSALNSSGSYGSKGIASDTNEPPALYSPLFWTDNEGNLWLFGGIDAIAHECKNALWRYDPTSNEWTWISGSDQGSQPGTYGTLGIPSPDNIPGGRGYGALTWTDESDNLWLYGGSGYDENGTFTQLADLWKYDINSNEWTWMYGYSHDWYTPVYDSYQEFSIDNFPGSRDESTVTWTDNQNDFWFFGGRSPGYNNDVWKYDPAINQWAWMRGGTGTNPNYGLKGVENATNDPGARTVFSKWVDAQCNLWIFGGMFNYSDLWRLNTGNLNWTWMGGTNVNGDPGLYGNYCDTIIQSHPRARWENRACWTDSCANFWMFGGILPDTATYLVYENDLWFYNSLNGIWTFAKGDSDLNKPGDFGIQGVVSASNLPPGRGGAATWKDEQGNFWLFGGTEKASIGSQSFGNDLWKFIPDLSCINSSGCNYSGCFATEINPTMPSHSSSVSPNPFITSTTVTLPNYSVPFNLQLFDELGREAALRYHITQQGNKTMLTIARGELPSGMYFLSVASGEKREVMKVMVE